MNGPIDHNLSHHDDDQGIKIQNTERFKSNKIYRKNIVNKEK